VDYSRFTIHHSRFTRNDSQNMEVSGVLFTTYEITIYETLEAYDEFPR
jgi:hypothetical protein